MRQALVDLGLDDDTCRQPGHSRAQGRRGVAAGSHRHAATLRQGLQTRFWWSRKSARSSNTSSRKSCTTGAPMCAPRCWASSTKAGRQLGRRMEHAQPQPELAAARRQADLTPAMIAKAHCQAPEEAGRARARGRSAWTRAWPSSTAQRARAGRAQVTPSATGRPGSAAAARTTPAPSVPEGSRAVAGIGCHYMANWMPDRKHRHLHANGRRGRDLGRPGAVHR